MPANSTSPADDIAPIAVADAFTLTAQQASLVTHSIFTYVDSDGVTQSVDTLINGVTVDVTANDTDPNPNDAGHFWIFDLTQPVDSHGVPAGSVSIETDANGHQVIRFYDATPDDSQDQYLTFTYRAGDQWATSDPATWANTVSAPVTVTIKISGNAVPGQTMTGGNHPQALTGGAGNDKLMGGNQDDTLSGMGGSDTLSGDNGRDLLLGGDGKDSLSGGNGSDTLNGGNGDDTLAGGNGADNFVFDYAFGHDVITDFDSKTDKIYVDHSMWGTFADLKAHAAQVGTSVVLTSDFDGYTITLQNMKLAALAAGEFIFT
jgi:Ca2+-binding RTX toxin-like protein